MSKYGGYLPEEMMREILLRLPVKSLLRCKSVCKPWLSTISNPDFIKSQLHYAIIASPTVIGVQERPPTEDDELDMDYDEFELSELERKEQLRLEHLFEALLDVNRQDLSTTPICIHRIICEKDVIGSHNGILCVVDGFDYDDVYFWNPSIRQCKKIPTSPHRGVLVGFEFGYDSISDDYMFIRILYYYGFGFCFPILQVYSSNADSWTEFQHPILESKLRDYRTTIVINGVLYFTTHHNYLVSFDLHKQVCILVPFPTSIQTRKSDILDFKGSVAMVFDSGSGVDLWTLDDVSGKVSWTKRFSIEDDSKLDMWLTCYLGAGLFFGRKYINRMYLYNFLYDYEKKETKYCHLGENEIYLTFNHTDTLISLNGFEKVESREWFVQVETWNKMATD